MGHYIYKTPISSLFYLIINKKLINAVGNVDTYFIWPIITSNVGVTNVKHGFSIPPNGNEGGITSRS